MEDEVLANAGVDVFEEVFKLIFAKLYDEYQSKDDKTVTDYLINSNLSEDEIGDFEKVQKYVSKIDDSNFRILEFRNTGQTDIELKNKIQDLFKLAINKWPGVFPENSSIELTPLISRRHCSALDQ